MRARASGGAQLAAVALPGTLAVTALALAVADHAPGAVDRVAADWATDLHERTVVSVVRVFTALGSSPVAGLVVLVAVIGLVRLGRAPTAVALAAGALLTFAGVHAVKALVDRPRPPAPFVHTTLASYPSGHAAYAVGLVAVALAVRGPRSSPFVAVALVLALGVGLSRVYLRAHFLTDVLGGWALGSACFAAAAAAVMLVGRLRHNGAPA